MHKRLIVIATVQRQLCKPGAVEDIELGTYLTQLFDGPANSIVAEDGPETIAASASAGTIKPEDAVSIGLIATEL